MSEASQHGSSGMTLGHFEVFRACSKALGLILGVRNTNQKSTPWIERGYPAKPLEIKHKTSKSTGKVTVKKESSKQSLANDASEDEQNLFARFAGLDHFDLRAAFIARGGYYYVIDLSGYAVNGGGFRLSERFDLSNPLEQNETGQLIDPRSKKALVGDYDLLCVMDQDQPGPASGSTMRDDEYSAPHYSNKQVETVRAWLNSALDQPRVMHGPDEMTHRDVPDGGATIFWPSGHVECLEDRDAVAMWFAAMGRPTYGRRRRPINFKQGHDFWDEEQVVNNLMSGKIPKSYLG